MQINEAITYIDLKKWNNSIIKVSKIILIITFIFEMILFFMFKPTMEFSKANYFFHFIFLPCTLQGFTILFLYFSNNVLCRFFNDSIVSICMIIGEVTFVLISIAVHSSVPFMCSVLFFPIIFTYIYKSKFYCYFACFISIIGYSLIILGIIPTTEFKPNNSSITYLIVFITLIILTALCSLAMKSINIEYDINTKKLKQKATEMKYAAELDSLTGLYNHNTFYRKLNDNINNLNNDKLHILVIDIDNFKKINDTYGHVIGDHVIETVSKIIKNSLSSNDFASRYGGEEFVGVYHNISQKEVLSIANKIRKDCIDNVVYYTSDSIINYTVSIGVCSYLSDIKNGQDLFKYADIALYEAKNTGKNKVVLYNKKLDDTI